MRELRRSERPESIENQIKRILEAIKLAIRQHNELQERLVEPKVRMHLYRAKTIEAMLKVAANMAKFDAVEYLLYAKKINFDEEVPEYFKRKKAVAERMMKMRMRPKRSNMLDQLRKEAAAVPGWRDQTAAAEAAKKASRETESTEPKSPSP